MDDEIHKAAVEFKKLMGFEYKFVIGFKGKSTEVALRFDEYGFHHLCGLHKLDDILKPTEKRDKIFNDILDGKITNKYLETSKFYISEGVNDRIKRVSKLSTILESTRQVYKYNNNANPHSRIKGDFLLKHLASDNRNVYFVVKSDSFLKNKFFGLSIFSKSQSEKDFAAGHTPNTLLYVSKTPLTADKQLDKEKEIVIYQRPSYAAPNNSNIKIVKFTPITSVLGDTAALAVPRPSFGQAITNLINRWTDKIKENVKMRRELKSAKQEIAELKETISDRDEQIAKRDELITQKDEQLATKDDKISALEKQNLTLMSEVNEQKNLVRATNPPKTLSQKIEEAKRKSHDRNAANPRPNLPNQNRHKR